MSIDTISSLKSMLSNDSNIKVCILDNNMIEVLTGISSVITQDLIFGQYDIILIPGWVYEEIQDSEVRARYIIILSLIGTMNVSPFIGLLVLVSLFHQPAIILSAIHNIINIHRLILDLIQN
jgi:hypothetical protein